MRTSVENMSPLRVAPGMFPSCLLLSPFQPLHGVGPAARGTGMACLFSPRIRVCVCARVCYRRLCTVDGP